MCFPHQVDLGQGIIPSTRPSGPTLCDLASGLKVLNLMRAALDVVFPEEFLTTLPPPVSLTDLRIYCLHGSSNTGLMFKTGALV